jgi:hypothetical protein
MTQYSEIQIHRAGDDWRPEISVDQDEFFGILKIKIAETEVTTTPIFILFTIDNTGSMQSNSGNFNRHSKMDYVKQTFKNMIHYLSNQSVDIYIRVHAFNIKVQVIIENIKISKENVAELNAKIQALDANDCTDIGLALEKAADEMANYSNLYPNHQIAHIFMTDGEPTIGDTNPIILADIVNNSFPNIFVGFGLDHNAGLMRKLSEVKNAEYQFVDNMENTSLVYGETIHRLLFPALKNVTIQMVDGFVYNWQTNEWTDSLYEPVLVGDMEKIYHVKTRHIYDLEAHVSGVSCDNEGTISFEAYSMPQLLDGELTPLPIDLTKYMFRQAIQEHLFLGKDTPNIREYRSQLNMLFQKMRKYMRVNNLMDDSFMKVLCNDISLTYKFIGTRHGNMVLLSRGTSQGRQQSYNIGDISDDPDEIPRTQLRRTNAVRTNFLTVFREPSVETDLEDELNNPDDLDNFVTVDENISCYATPTMLDTMRCMSQSVDEEI